jgi:chemotaxis protein methyltransferase CheR
MVCRNKMEDWKYENFKRGVEKLIKINLGAYKEAQMKRRIEAFMMRNGYESYSRFLRALSKDMDLRSKFLNHLTINVSEFFRNPIQWETLQKEIIPYILDRFKFIKVWSTACSTGEEPYSAVMVLNQFLPLHSIRVLATDIDQWVINKALVGIYNKKNLDNLPEEFRNRYFSIDNDKYVIKEEIKSCVKFKKLDLLEDEYPTGCNLIICRNVMIYFTKEIKDMIYEKFSKVLLPGGILFVGSTEHIINSKQFNLAPKKSFFYENRYGRTLDNNS